MWILPPVCKVTTERGVSRQLSFSTGTVSGSKGVNLPWGTGETPIAQILQTVAKNKWTTPATVELEYAIPKGSNAPKEVAQPQTLESKPMPRGNATPAPMQPKPPASIKQREQFTTPYRIGKRDLRPYSDW